MKKLISVLMIFIALSIPALAQDEIQTLTEAAKAEALLKKNPTDFNLRLRLMWFYGPRESASDKAALQRLRLDCIRFTPDHEPSPFTCTGVWTPEDVKNPDYLALKNEWLKQIGLHKQVKIVLLNAFNFFVDPEPEIAENILNDGKNLEPFDPEFTHLQIENEKTNLRYYSILVGLEDQAAMISKIDAALKKIVASGKDGISRIDKKEEKSDADHDFRRSFLADGASAAFDLEDFAVAGEFAGLLLKSLDGNDESAGVIYFYRNVKYFQIGISINGRVELRKGNLDKAKEYLMNSLRSLSDDMTDAAELDAKFLSEILVVDGRRTVLEYLAIFEKYKSDSEDWKEIITNFKTALEKGKNPNFESSLLALY